MIKVFLKTIALLFVFTASISYAAKAPLTGYPSNYKAYGLASSPDFEKLKESYEVLARTDKDARNTSDAVKVFPAIDILRALLLEHSKEDSAEWIDYCSAPVIAGHDVTVFLLGNNDNFHNWFKKLDEAQQRRLLLAIRAGGTFLQSYATLDDLKNDDLLFNVIGPNIFNRWYVKCIIERLSLEPKYVEQLQDRVFLNSRARHCNWGGYREFFVDYISRVSDAEAVKILKDEINSYLSILNPSNQTQVSWLNQLRYLLKLKQEVK